MGACACPRIRTFKSTACKGPVRLHTVESHQCPETDGSRTKKLHPHSLKLAEDREDKKGLVCVAWAVEEL